MIDAVAFDLDGTLVRLPIDYGTLFEEFKRIMRIKNVRPLVDTVSKADGKTRELVFCAWETAELSVFKEVSINESGMKIYRMHADKRKALVTLQGKAVVDAILRKFGLSFAAVVTREDALFRVDQLAKAAEQLKVKMPNLLFVGNSEGDAVAAKKLCCQFLMVE